MKYSFFNSWKRNTKIIETKLYENWFKKGLYTSLILKDNDCIIDKVSKDLELKYYTEYYSIDAVFYIIKDKVPNLNENWVWLQNIKIAFEHENDFGLTYQEISHLTITNCELRVLVTYPSGDETKMLDYYKQIIDGNKSCQNENSFLLIFGYKSDNETIRWKGLTYERNNWIEIS